jgi:hypothetical protein
VLSLRVTRDRRGYESIYLMLEQRRRNRPERRLLYWTRRSSVARVGREPFDDDTRAMLERANPGINFDWEALLKSFSASAAAARYAAMRQKAGAGTAAPTASRIRPDARAWREDDEPSELDTLETTDVAARVDVGAPDHKVS